MTASSAGSSSSMSARGLDISLAALQRQDPYIQDIVDVASQVALYTFNNRANEWVRLGSFWLRWRDFSLASLSCWCITNEDSKQVNLHPSLESKIQINVVTFRLRLSSLLFSL